MAEQPRQNQSTQQGRQNRSASKRTLGNVFHDLAIAVADIVVGEIKDAILPTTEVTEKSVAGDALLNIASGVKNADGEAILTAHVAGEIARVAVRRLRAGLPATDTEEAVPGVAQRVDGFFEKIGNLLEQYRKERGY